MKNYKIEIAGTKYVGKNNGILLSLHNEVIVLDIIPSKIKMLDNKKSLIEDKEIQEILSNNNLNFKATLDKYKSCKDEDLVIISSPTAYVRETYYLNTKLAEVTSEDIIEMNQVL